MSENNTSNDAANGANNKNATGTMFTRFADYFVICGLDLESGLEPQWNKNIGKRKKKSNSPEVYFYSSQTIITTTNKKENILLLTIQRLYLKEKCI